MASSSTPVLILEYLVTVLVIELTPGPNMGYLAIVAARQGRRAGLAGVAGAAVALSVYVLAAAEGLAKLVLSLPSAYAVLRWLGVGYLLWLAVETWRDGASPPPPASVLADAPGRAFRRSLVSNLLNIKAALLYVVVLPSFLRPGREIAPQVLMLGAIHVALSTAVHTGVVFGAAWLSGRGSEQPRSSAVDRAFALALCATAVWLAWASRR